MSNEKSDIDILLPILRKIPLFSTLDENLHREIIKHIVLMYYPGDYELFSEGEDGDALYIIKNGSVKIFHQAPEEGDLPIKIAEINDGGFFGEMALISDLPRNASAIATIDSEIFILSKDDFKALLESNIALAEQISATVVERTNDNLNAK